MKYITFDPYYSKTMYNNFLLSAFNNNIFYREFISIRAPYYFYLQIQDTDTPKFLDYETTKDTRWMVSKLNARYPNEEFILKRRENDPKADISRFIENDILYQARFEKFVCVFYFSGTQLREISTYLPDKIYILGLKGTYKVAMCFNPYILSVIAPSQVILTEQDGDFRNIGELEQRINYTWKPNLKLTHKTLESSYYKNGKYYPIEKPLIKIS